MTIDSNFNFINKLDLKGEFPFQEHFEEIGQRSLALLIVLLLCITLSFFEVKYIVKILEFPVEKVKFFQSSPSEYFFSTLRIAFYTGLLFTGPFLMTQIMCFVKPGITKTESNWFLPLLLISIFLFILSLIFSYNTLIPAALNFFVSYSNDVLEPFWSFDQYFEFILVIFYSTGIAFQIPIVQILFGLANVISISQMLGAWRYVVLIATIFGAILTPSTDPLTQILLSFAILLLYFIGLGVLFLLKNKQSN